SRAPDPDLALSELVRLRESLDDDEGATRENGVAALVEALRTEETLRSRLLALLGSSSALGDHLVAGPTRWTRLCEVLQSRAVVIATLLTSVEAASLQDVSCASTDIHYAHH